MAVASEAFNISQYPAMPPTGPRLRPWQQRGARNVPSSILTASASVYDVYEPDGDAAPVRGAVQILHGVGNAGRYAHVAEALTAAGFLVSPTITADTGAPAWSSTAVMRGRLGRLGPGGPRLPSRPAQLSGIIRADHPSCPSSSSGIRGARSSRRCCSTGIRGTTTRSSSPASALRWPGALNSGDLNAPWGPKRWDRVAVLRPLGRRATFLDDPLTTSEPLQAFGPLDTLRLIGKPAKNLPATCPC
jgi:hypothetical protein